MSFFTKNGDHVGTQPSSANLQYYDNTESGLEAATTQEAIDEISSDVSSLNENLTKCELKKLWENPSPSSAFEPQTISINLSDYDYIKIICMWDYANKNCGSLDILKNEVGTISIVMPFSSGIYCVSRNVTPNDNGIEFTQGVRGNATSNSVSNTYCVPISIYGGKFA